MIRVRVDRWTVLQVEPTRRCSVRVDVMGRVHDIRIAECDGR